MPDPTLQGDIRTGFDSNSMFELKLDTFKTMSDVLNKPDNPYLPPTPQGSGALAPTLDLPQGMTYEDALQSNDPKIRDLGVKHLEQETASDPYYKLGLGEEIRTPYDKAQKYIDKKFGFDATVPDIEDYYYRNDYMQDGVIKRTGLNVLRFLGRTVVPAVMKLGEGFGYVGAMVTSIGSTNYWADVADNAMSKWLETQEQSFKDKIVPIYHAAGFDEKGFFSQMTNYAFWNEDVADGVAFMASAAIPAMALGKLGMLSKVARATAGIAEGEQAFNAFGKAFSTTSRIGKVASSVGLGSPAELAAWTFNTAMESAMEGSQVFKDGLAKMKELRDRGVGEYANMSDEDMRTVAGKLAANTVGSNFMILGLSNAWENTLFFKPFKASSPTLKLGTDWVAGGSKTGLSRGVFYGKKAAEGFLAEGLWEENAQLAVQRMNSLDDQGNPLVEGSGMGAFFKQLKKQTVGAFTGDDKEAAKNIGLGGLIGIVAGGGFSKLSGERKELLAQYDRIVDESKILKNNLFSVNDVYERDADNNIKIVDGTPVISPAKLQSKKDGLEKIFGKVQLSTLEEFQNSAAVDAVTKAALSQYISSMHKLGIEDVSARFSQLTSEQAAIFGINQAVPTDKAGEYGIFAKKAEDTVVRTEKEELPNSGLSAKDYDTKSKAAKSDLYTARIQNIIFSDYIDKENSKMLSTLNNIRTLSNASLSAFPAEQINFLKYQLYYTQKAISDPSFTKGLSELEQKYHLDKEKELIKKIEDYKTENASMLEETRVDASGYYIAQHKDANGNLVDSLSDAAVQNSNQRRANYTNIIEQGQWRESNLLSKDWLKFYEGLKEIPIIKEIKAQIKAEESNFKSSIFSKHTETTPGDFRRVVRLVGSIISGKTEFSPEETQLRQNYGPLVEELIPLYEKSLTQETKNIFTSKLNAVTKTRDALLSAIFEKKYKIGDLSVSTQTLTDTLLNRLKDNKVGVQEIQTLIYSTQKAIDDLDESLKADEKELANLDRKIAALEEEAQAGDFQGIRNVTTELKKEKDWITNEIADKKSLLDRLIKIIKEVTNLAYKQFADFKGNFFVSRKNFNEHLEKGSFGAVEGFREIAVKESEKRALEKELEDLQKIFKYTEGKITYYQDIINATEQAVLNGFDEQLKFLTNKPQVIQSSTEEQQTTDSFIPEFGAPPVSNMSTNVADDWDGPDYLRPLATKFITSTFSDRRVYDAAGTIIGSDYESLSQPEKDHFHLMEYLSSGKNTAEINQKLGRGKLKVLAVTEHNIDSLGLRDLLYTKIEKNDQVKFWEETDPAIKRIDFLHVIQDKGKLYFVDKELNKLGEISEIKDADKPKIARSILRSSRFSSKEESQYDEQQANNKTWEQDKAKALEYGTNQRKKFIDNSKNFTLATPTGVFSFDITRGIPVRTESVTENKVHNPVTDVLLSEAQINAQTVVVTTTGKYTLNETNITLPVGRAYIKTGGLFEKLHYADNNILDENTVNTILTVFDKLSAIYVQKVEEVMKKQLGDKKLSDLSYSDRMKVILAFNKSTKGSFNKSYMRYLNSVIHFGLLSKNEKVHPNKIYLKGSFIHFGDTRIDISTGGFSTNPEAKQYLSKLYHNVLYYANAKKASEEYIEYYLDNGELKDRKWKTYNHYLLSKNFPNGSVRTYIPITTQIHTPEQAAQEANNPPGTYTSQSIILGVPYGETIKKKNIIEQEDEPTEQTLNDNGEYDFGELTSVSDLLSGKKPKVSTPKPTSDLMSKLRERSGVSKAAATKAAAEEKASGKVTSPMLRKLLEAREKKEAEEKAGETTNRTEPLEDEDLKWNDDTSAFRVAKAGFFKTEEDLESVIAYAQRVLPQFPVERLKKIIQKSENLQVWGEFTGQAIRLWEGAEEGTLYHEIFEGVVNKILTDYEWNSIAKEFKSRKGTFTDRETGETVAYSKATPHQIKEEIAEEFRTFKMTGKVFDGQKNTRTFFQVILDFIKKFFGFQNTIKGIFDSIDEGKFINRGVRGTNRFDTNYRTKEYPIPYRKYNEFLQGFTAVMFRDIFETTDSIVKLDEVGEVDSTLYDRIRDKIDDMYITMLEEFDAGAFPTNTPNQELNEINRKKEKALEDIVNNWDKIKNKWADFVQNHKFELRKFRIKFDEEYQLASDDENMSNRNEYSGNPFEVSNKNSASLSVRFMIGTLLKAVVKKGRDGKFTTGLDRIFPNLVLDNSSSRLPQLENYDRMMSMVASEFANLNDMTLIEQKLKQLSGISRLENASAVDEQQEIAQSITSDEAAFTILYTRLFSPNRVISQGAMWNLRTKFLSYTSKQFPVPYILMMNDNSGVSLIQSTNRISNEKFYKRLRAAMTKNVGIFFTKKVEKGIKTYVPKKQTVELGANFFIAPEKTKEKIYFGQFLQFLGLYNQKDGKGVLTPQFLIALKESDIDKYRELVRVLHNIGGRLQTVEAFAGTITVANLDIFGYTNEILAILDEIAASQSEKLLTHLDGNNNATQDYISPSFTSRVLAEMSNVNNLGELLEAFPHLHQHVRLQDGIYITDSIMINKMFNPDGSRKSKILSSLSYIEGIKSAEEGGKETFKKTARLEYHQRIGLQFTLGLSGMYNALTADSETEWAFNMGEFVPFENYIESNEQGKNNLGEVVSDFYIPKLEAEIRLALEFNSTHQQMNTIHPETGYKIGKSLRFFKDILQYTDKGQTSRELVDKIHEDIQNGKQPSVIISENRTAIRNAIKNYIQFSTLDTFNNLIENRVINETETSEGGIVYSINDLTTILEKKFGNSHSLTGIRDVVMYAVVNTQLANFEQFKLIYGDVAQYKDWEKRAKSLFGPIEQAYYDRTGEFNTWLNENKNNAEFEDEVVAIPNTDIFSTSFRNSITGSTIDDIMTVNPELLNTLREMGAKFDAYEDVNEADGQSISTLQAFRQVMIKAGWRWTQKFEDFFQYDTALARQELAEIGAYTYSSEELRALDEKIVDKYKDNPPTEGPSPLKTLIPSVRPDGTQDLMKHSVYPNSWQIAREHHELKRLYVTMLNERTDIRNFKSAHKVGADLDNEGRVSSHYKRIGSSVSPFELTDLQTVGNVQYELSFRTLGIQVETQGGGKTRLGSQLTKDINLNLMPNGVPSDFRKDNNSLTEEQLINSWLALPQEDKNKSKDYKLVQNTIKTLENLKDKSVMDTFDTIGIGYTYENGEFKYSSVDLVKLQQHIMNELTRLDIDDNIIDGLELNEDLDAFLHPSESLPSYNVVSNVIWALADKSISALKVNGVPYIQVSSAFFNDSQRGAAYRDGDRWIRVDNQEDFNRLQAEGKKLVLTASDLEFYTLEKDGKEIQGMEIKLPHIYRKKVNDKRRVLGLPIVSDEKLMEWLNQPENSKLLQGIGFRIPTQASSSIEFFTIKGFLPESFGKAVVVPSDITAKAGSDFDVDKLQTYLNNWKLNSEGMPVFEQLDASEDTSDRFITYVNQHVERNDRDIFKAMRESKEFIEKKGRIDDVYSKIADESEDIDEAKKEVKDEYTAGYYIFKELPLSIKQQYWEKEDELTNENFVTKLASYYNYTTEFIKTFEENKAVTLNVERIDKKTKKKYIEQEVVTAEEVVPRFNQMLDNYRSVIKLIKLKDEAFEKLTAAIARARSVKNMENRAFQLEMSNVIAEGLSLLNHEGFSKLPVHLQNSRGAVENEYFDSIRQILKQSERFLQLLSPNDMSNIKENRDTVQTAMDPEYKSDEKKELKYSNFLDINYLSDKRHSFIRGKYDIAIFAVSMTNYANSQITGLGITQGQVRPEDEAIMQAVGYDISLPFEEAPLLNINGWDFIPLGYEKSADGRYIMDKISGYINGAVDVAKDPVIIEMGMHSDMANVYMLLERAGIKGKNIALFLMQPSIRDYLRENIYRKNPEFGYSKFLWKKEINEYILGKYSTGPDMKYEKVEFTENVLADMVRKGEKIKREQKESDTRARNGKPRTKVSEWTDSEKKLQWLAFVNFLKMEAMANNLNDVRTSSNHDTSGIRSSHSLTRKDLIRNRTYEGNLIMAPTAEGGFENGADAIRKGTFIQKTIDLLNTFSGVFSTTNLFALQKNNPKEVLNKVARRIYKRNPYQREDDFNAVMKEYDAAIVDTLLNNYAKIGNVPIAALKNQLFLPSEVTSRGTLHANNLYETFDSIRTDDRYKRVMLNNFFMANLAIEFDDKLGVYTIDLSRTLAREDTLSRNLIINGWRDIIESSDEKLSQFGRALLYGTIIQYGVKPQRNSMTPLIPLEYYSQVSAPVIDNIQLADFSNFDEEVVRENAYKKNFVQQSEPMAMDYLDAGGNIVTIWGNRNAEQRKLKKRPTLTQRVFVRNMGTGELRKYFGEEAIVQKYAQVYGKSSDTINHEEFRNLFKEEIADANAKMVSRPVFMWQKYMDETDDNETILGNAPEFVAVKMPRPEYVVMVESIGEDGTPTVKRAVSRKVNEMIDKKDFSWAFIQVYKLVGLDGTKPSVLRFKEGKGKNKGQVSVSLLYKPINSAGDFGFNEVANLSEDDNGNVTGTPSILRSNIAIQEQTDEQIVETVKLKPGMAVKFVNRTMEEVRTEQETPITPEERVKKNLNVTFGKATPKNYAWAKRSPNSYEVSSKGDKRFSAFFAMIKKGTLLDLPDKPEYVLERDSSIEEIYQIGVKGYSSVNAGKGKAPLRAMTQEESWMRYKGLWEVFAEQNPALIDELAEKTKGKVLTDMFAKTDINQAHALSDILNERNPSDEEQITPTC
jgi:hypothetical protein